MNKSANPKLIDWKSGALVVLLVVLLVTNLVWLLKTADLVNYTVQKTQENSGSINTLRDCYERNLKPCPLQS